VADCSYGVPPNLTDVIEIVYIGRGGAVNVVKFKVNFITNAEQTFDFPLYFFSSE
jgi:hypothetical protein